MTTMYLHKIVPSSFVDGPGERAVCFFQGCSLSPKCPGCQSPHLWSFDGGHVAKVCDLAQTLILLSERHRCVSISGGEPSAQPKALAELVTLLKGADRHIVLFSGYTWKQLASPGHRSAAYMSDILRNIDILIDGRFVQSLDNDFLGYRGSSNQKIIDVPATLKEGRVVTLDFDNTLQVTATGDLILPAGMVADFADLGSVADSRRCGQVGA